MQKEFVEKLREFFGLKLTTDDFEISKHSTDASIFKVKPSAVLYPENAEDISKAILIVNQFNDGSQTESDWQKKISITARSAGTCMSGGSLNTSLILDFTKSMNKLLSFESDQITIEPGMYYRDFEKITLEKGLLLPCYTASKDLCALGGMFGNNSGGGKTLRYGKMADFVLSFKAILADGNLYSLKKFDASEVQEIIKQNNFLSKVCLDLLDIEKRFGADFRNARPDVNKNSSGIALWDALPGDGSIDFVRLFVGSQGTFGITTEMTLKLVPKDKFERLMVVFIKDLKGLSDAVLKMIPFSPESIESYDKHTMKLAFKFFPQIARKIGLKNVFKLALSFIPEILMIIKSGIPEIVLLVEFSGQRKEDLDNKIKKANSSISQFMSRIITNETEAQKYWTIRRESFSLLREKVKDRKASAFIDDVVVSVTKIPEFLPKIEKILKKYNLLYTIAGHVGNGNFHIIPLMDRKAPDYPNIITNASSEVYDLVAEFNGSMSGEHNDGIIRTAFLPKMFNPKVIESFQKTKQIFDPKEIFNPGKKTGNQIGDIRKYLLRD